MAGKKKTYILNINHLKQPANKEYDVIFFAKGMTFFVRFLAIDYLAIILRSRK